jgi:hypothetical protein
MANSRKHITELHQEINQWRNLVMLAKDEISIFEKELEEIVSKNTHSDLLRKVQHFESQFIIQKEASDALLHDLKIADNKMSDMTRNNPAADRILVDDHTDLRKKADAFEKIFLALRKEYREFLSVVF